MGHQPEHTPPVIWHAKEAWRFYGFAHDSLPTVILEVPRAKPKVEKCRTCGGSGQLNSGLCPVCVGKGEITLTMRPPKIGDCISNGWYQSVTHHISTMATAKQLTDWQFRHVARACFRNPAEHGEQEDSYIYRRCSLAEAEMGKPSSSGTEFHEAVARFLRDGTLSDDETKARAAVLVAKTLQDFGVESADDILTEVQFILKSVGTAGSMDIVALARKRGYVIIADEKSLVSKTYKPNNDYRHAKWGMQIAPYSRAFSDPGTIFRGVPEEWRKLPKRHLELIIGRDTGGVMVHDWDAVDPDSPKGLNTYWWRFLSRVSDVRIQTGYTPPGAEPIVLPPTAGEMTAMAEHYEED